MRIIYFGHYSALTGYGRACRDYCAALYRAGHDLRIVDWQSIPGNQERALGAPEPRFRALDDLLVPWPLALGDDDVAIVHGTPKLLAAVKVQGALPPGGRHVAMTTWETDTFPGEFIAPLGCYDRILVPSVFCRNAILAARDRREEPWVDDVVAVVPHTFDPDWWTPAPVSTFPPVNFYSVGAWSERKNHEAVIKAYLHAFTPDEPVRLTIISSASEGQRVTHAFQSVLGRSGLAPAQIPSIELVHTPLGDAEMRELLQRQHVYVNASRGEGWGLSVFEAALLGHEILTPDEASGEAQFLAHYDNQTEIDSRMTPCFAGPGLPIVQNNQVMGEKTLTVPGMNARGIWVDIDVQGLAAAMRDSVYCRLTKRGRHANTPRDVEIAAETHARMVNYFGYAAVAATLTEALQPL